MRFTGVLRGAGGVGEIFDVVPDRERELIGTQALFHKIEHEKVGHLAHDELCLVPVVRLLQHLPGADAVGVRPVGADVRDRAWLPAPGVVNEKLRLHAERFIEQLLVIEIPALPERAAGNIAHRVHSQRFQPPHRARADTPEIRERPVAPEIAAVAHFVKLRNAHAVTVRRDVLCFNVHCDLAEIEIRPDARRGGDAGRMQHLAQDLPAEVVRRHAVRWQIIGHIHKHLVNGVDVDILGRYVVQINVVDSGAVAHVVRHVRRRYDIIQLQRGVCRKLRRAARFPGERMARRGGAARGVDLPHRLHDLKKPGAARNAVGLERRRHRKADRLFRAGRVRHNKIRRHRVKTALHALHRGIERLEIDGKICPLSHGAPPSRLAFLYYISLLSEFQEEGFAAALCIYAKLPDARGVGEKRCNRIIPSAENPAGRSAFRHRKSRLAAAFFL